ncbi:MAG TPA: PEGA domain-containing protein [Longimicrobiales bacterium]|nr:PEGA domain-containing protein [Longimicrobiales bacterium]
MRAKLLVALLAVTALGACREPDAPLGTGRLFVSSDPQGGRIFIDGQDTGQLTPDTVFDLSSVRDVRVELEAAGSTYRYTARVLVLADQVTEVHGPLMARCAQAVSTACSGFTTFHTAAELQFATSSIGALLTGSGSNPGVVWPPNGTDAYNAAGIPLFAARVGGAVVALGAYDHRYLAGRPAPAISASGGTLRVAQPTWIVPPIDDQGVAVPRGIEVRQYVIASDAVPGVVLIELWYHNISALPLYATVDGGPGSAGITWEDAYIGLGLDPDIGNADDDWVSYDPDLDAVFTYDAAFSEPAFGAAPAAPGLVGLRVLRVPAGAGIVLNAWERQRDWVAGTLGQTSGFGMVSGTSSFSPDHPGTQIGYLPPAPHDSRILAAAGPIRLAPGDSASIVLAYVVAAPQPGTFTSGEQVAPGEPADTSRPLYAIAELLRERLVAAEALLPLLP